MCLLVQKRAPPLTPSHPPDNVTPIHESKAITTRATIAAAITLADYLYIAVLPCSKWPDNRPEDH